METQSDPHENPAVPLIDKPFRSPVFCHFKTVEKFFYFPSMCKHVEAVGSI